MNFDNLIDPLSAAIVAGGTLVATLLRCGLSDARVTVSALAGLACRRFDAEQIRADLAAHVRQIGQDGLYRAEPLHLGDAELDDVSGAVIGSRTVGALHAAHKLHRKRRIDQAHRAARTVMQGAELAPVFGLAGTLVSLSQLSAQGGDGGLGAAISMAVTTTLYGLLLANLLLAPLARLIERASLHEEQERQQVIDWLESQLNAVIAAPVSPAAHRRVSPMPVG